MTSHLPIPGMMDEVFAAFETLRGALVQIKSKVDEYTFEEFEPKHETLEFLVSWYESKRKYHARAVDVLIRLLSFERWRAFAAVEMSVLAIVQDLDAYYADEAVQVAPETSIGGTLTEVALAAAARGSIAAHNLVGVSSTGPSDMCYVHLSFGHVLKHTHTIFSADVAAVVASKALASSTNPLQTVNVLMASFDVSDIIADFWTTKQGIDVIPALGYAAACHLAVVLAINFYLIHAFVKEIQHKERVWYREATQNGRSLPWKALLVVGLFGPKVLKVIGTNLFGMKLFSLNLDRITTPLIRFNWGAIAESVPQTAFAVLQKMLAKGKLTPTQQLTVYVSLGFSVFNILTCAMELAFGKSDEFDEAEERLADEFDEVGRGA